MSNAGRTKNGRFKKGMRPVGRTKGTPNKIVPEVRLLSQQYGAECIDTLVRIMRNRREDTTCVILACKELLLRGYGRPAMTHNIAGFDGGPLDLNVINNMSSEQLEAFLDKFTQLLTAERRLQ